MGGEPPVSTFPDSLAGRHMLEADVLYHYTSQAGLLGIIANDSIWATDIRALNDWTEFRHLFEEAGVKCWQYAEAGRERPNA